MRFLLLNRTFVPDVASSGQHLADLALELVKLGHEVTVVTSRRAYGNSACKFAANETWRGVRILRVGSIGSGQGTLWNRALDGFSFGVLAFVRACLLPHVDVVVTLSSPPLISVLGLCLARLRQCRFVYWVMDLNPDEAFAAGWLRAQSAVGFLLERVSKRSLRGADRVIVLDRFMLRRVEAKGVCRSRISVVPPWSHDLEISFDLRGREEFRRKHGLEGKFVVMYSGNHSLCHPLDTVLAAARMLAGEPNIVFCFIGGGAQFRAVEKEARAARNERLTHSKILCLPYQPLSRLSASLSAADLHLVIMGDGFVGIVHPCKIYNILRIGTPIIYVGPRPSAASEILDEVGPPRSACVSHGDAKELVRQIKRLWRESKATRARKGELAQQFSRERVLPRLVAALGGQDK